MLDRVFRSLFNVEHKIEGNAGAVRYNLADLIRYRMLLIAAGYPDGNDCDALKADPALKIALGCPPVTGANLCSQPTISRLENLPGATALKRMMAAMITVFCDSFLYQIPMIRT